MRLQNIVAAASMLPAASSFYLQIHNQIGFLAENFMAPRTHWLVQQILEPEYRGSIGRAAAWADTVSRTTHKYSYTWHWTSTNDDAPHVCNVYYNRDCQATGCSIQQIANQTFILGQCFDRVSKGYLGPGNPDVNCQQALKWVLHFLGDVHQPMHNSGPYGGNLFKVRYNGSETNMHQAWDRWMLYTKVGISEGFPADWMHPFFTWLKDRILNDMFSTPTRDWVTCTDNLKHDNSVFDRALHCAESWSREANAITCDYAYGRYVNGSDLYWDHGYTDGAYPIIQLQLAKAAYRLAGWLNRMKVLSIGPDTVDESSNNDYPGNSVETGGEGIWRSSSELVQKVMQG